MRRSGIQVMGKLIGLVKPLAGYMVLAILLGAMGNMVAIAIPILGIYGMKGESLGKYILPALIFCGVFRGFFRYGEQTCNHYIAFKLLALIRHKIFVKLRTLAPAKLESQEKGNLISVITSDIELLEVFYAHTISPIVIAVIVSGIMTSFLGHIHWIFGSIAIIAYILVGLVIPLFFKGDGGEVGYQYREKLGTMNSFFLDSIRGLREIMQFGTGEKRITDIGEQVQGVEHYNVELKKQEGNNKALTDASILFIAIVMLSCAGVLVVQGEIEFYSALLAVVGMLSSFGPVVAISSLSNNLFHTIASGNRVLDLLESEPTVQDITGEERVDFGNVVCREVDFQYGVVPVLENINIEVKQGQSFGIYGKSGCGKSTLLKLLMRFFEPLRGEISINQRNLSNINTENLRNMESYVTQETHLFQGTIKENIKIANEDASDEEVEVAAKKASIHEFIMTLPKNYDTSLGELGEGLSGGERQRIGLARAFLHKAPFLLLDEPTSNLDSLNESVILKSLQDSKEDKMVILVSHRKSTLGIVDTAIGM